MATGNIYILMEARLVALYKEESEYEILDKFLGKTMFGKSYKPLFPYFSEVETVFIALKTFSDQIAFTDERNRSFPYFNG